MLKIIIVDDERRTREGLKKNIKWAELGIETVETADDGIEALEIAINLEPDIVVCDIKMPEMDGIEFATRLREKLPEVQIIFLSGYADKEYLKSAIRLKAVEYVEKPVDIEEIAGVIKKAAAICESENRRKNKIEEIKSHIVGSMPYTLEQIKEYIAEGIISLEEGPQAEIKAKIGKTINQVIEHINVHFNEELLLKDIADHVYLTPQYLCLLFKKETGKTINRYLSEIRIQKSKEYLKDKRMTLYEVSYRVGFNDQNYYTKVFKKLTGVSPSMFREQLL